MLGDTLLYSWLHGWGRPSQWDTFRDRHPPLWKNGYQLLDIPILEVP